MSLARIAAFAAGYVAGTRAGRERYEQIIAAVEQASRRLEEYSSRRPPGRQIDRRAGARRG